jgi:hypothetical protein
MISKSQASFLTSEAYFSKLGLALVSKKNTNGRETMNVVLKAPNKATGQKAFTEIKKDLGRFENVKIDLKGLNDVIEVNVKGK